MGAVFDVVVVQLTFSPKFTMCVGGPNGCSGGGHRPSVLAQISRVLVTLQSRYLSGHQVGTRACIGLMGELRTGDCIF